MPLISSQHILTVFGLDTEDAIEKLNAKLDELPDVKIVSMNVVTRTITVMGKSKDIPTIFAVVEEV